MTREFKRYQTENGTKYVRYYKSEGDNSAFTQHDGATRRAIETRASLVAAAKVGSRYGADNPEFQAWLKTPNASSKIDTHIRLEFIKECERLALRPEKELEQLREEDSKYIGIINSKERNALYKEAIYEMAQHRR